MDALLAATQAAQADARLIVDAAKKSSDDAEAWYDNAGGAILPREQAYCPESCRLASSVDRTRRPSLRRCADYWTQLMKIEEPLRRAFWLSVVLHPILVEISLKDGYLWSAVYVFRYDSCQERAGHFETRISVDFDQVQAEVRVEHKVVTE
jgi:hypothetical protein